MKTVADIDWDKLVCQDSVRGFGEAPVTCCRPAKHIVFDEFIYHHVVLMCDACADHAVKSRGAIIVPLSRHAWEESQELIKESRDAPSQDIEGL